MRFGLFCLMQRPGVPFTSLFDDQLAEIIHAETLGFDEVWFAEHRYANGAISPAPIFLWPRWHSAPSACAWAT